MPHRWNRPQQEFCNERSAGACSTCIRGGTILSRLYPQSWKNVKILVNFIPPNHSPMKLPPPRRTVHLISIAFFSLLISSAFAQSATFYSKCECPVMVVPWYSTSCLQLPSGPSSPDAISVGPSNTPATITPPSGFIIYQLDFYYPTTGGTFLYSWNCAQWSWSSGSSPINPHCENEASNFVTTLYPGLMFEITCRHIRP